MASRPTISMLRCPITVRGYATTEDAIGGRAITWTTRGSTRAMIEDISKGESFRAARTESVAARRVVIRRGSIPVVEAVEGQEGTASYCTLVFSEEFSEDTPTGLPDDWTPYSVFFLVDGQEVGGYTVGSEVQTYGALMSLLTTFGTVEQTGPDAITITSSTTGIESQVAILSPENDIFAALPLVSADTTNGEEYVEAVEGSAGLTDDCAIIYDGRAMSIKSINNISEGSVEFVEIICTSGDGLPPGVLE